MGATVAEEAEAGVPVREGEYGGSVAAVEPGGVEYIPDGGAARPPVQLFWTWMSPNFEFATVYVGVLPVVLFGGGFWLTVVGLLLGTALGAVTHGWLSTFGPRYGVPQLIQSRAAFGFVGNLLPAALNTLTSGAGWVAVNSVSGAFAVQTFFNHVGWSVPPFWLALAVVVAIEVAIAFVGYNMVHQFERVIFPFLGLVFAACCLYIFGHTNPGLGFNPAAPAAAGGQVGAFILAVFFAYAYAVSWNPYGADYARYLPREHVGARASRSPPGSASSSRARSSRSPARRWPRWRERRGDRTTFPPTSSSNRCPTRSASSPPSPSRSAPSPPTSSTCTARRCPSSRWASGVTRCAAAGPSWRWRSASSASPSGLTGSAAPGSKYEAFLFFNTYWIVPFIAVVLTDWTLRRGRYRWPTFFDPRHRPWKGVAAMLAGIAASFPVLEPDALRRRGARPTPRSSATSASWSASAVTVAVYLALRPLRACRGAIAAAAEPALQLETSARRAQPPHRRPRGR